MLIQIVVESQEPVAGTVAVDDGSPRAFVGWLQLLRLLSEQLDPTPHSKGVVQ